MIFFTPDQRVHVFFTSIESEILTEGFFVFIFIYYIQHCFICRLSDSTGSVDAGIEPRTVATLTLTARCYNHSARPHPYSTRSHEI
jgi:hypothetical protein